MDVSVRANVDAPINQHSGQKPRIPNKNQSRVCVNSTSKDNKDTPIEAVNISYE